MNYILIIFNQVPFAHSKGYNLFVSLRESIPIIFFSKVSIYHDRLPADSQATAEESDLAHFIFLNCFMDVTKKYQINHAPQALFNIP